jgi:hypothetical protein
MLEETLHPAVRRHLDTMTDAVGMMQHAVGSTPDPAHGYCTDDVSRALQVDMLQQAELGWATVEGSAWRSYRFLDAAFEDDTGRFRNFRSIDGSWLPGIASEDSQGRAMLALGDVVLRSPDDRLTAAATTLFDRALATAGNVAPLRAAASVLLGSVLSTRRAPLSRVAAALPGMAASFHSRFAAVSDPSWPWPEPTLTYENALPARALIVAGQAVGSAEMTDLGLRILDWQIDVQVAVDGHFAPIGNGWWPHNGARSRFDQQPIEATAMLLAAADAFTATSDPRYRMAMERAYGWFLGRNDLGVPVVDPARGAGFDGLTPDGVNVNQGAESTLMWLMAVEVIRLSRADVVQAPPAPAPHARAAVGAGR